jgi:hypothetical protein
MPARKPVVERRLPGERCGNGIGEMHVRHCGALFAPIAWIEKEFALI